MKKLIFALAALLCFVGCEYDDTEIKNSIEQIEKRLSAVETVQNAYKNNLFIKSVVQTTNGYTITFSDGSTATITNGKDGADGKDGKDGVDGADGKDGVDGTPGKDGIDGKDGDTLIESITIGENEVIFVLTDGRTLSIPLYNALSVTFDVDDTVVVAPNSTLTVGYSVESNIKDIVVEVTSSADIKARVVKEGDLTGKIEIKTGEAIDEYSKVVVFVSNGEKVIMRSITFEQEGLQIMDNTTKNAPAEGGEVVLEYLTNVECEVVIPEDAQSWIYVVPATRALRKQTIALKLEANDDYNRSATIVIQSVNKTLKLEYTIEQNGKLGVEIDPTAIPDNEIWYRSFNGEIYDLSGYSEFNNGLKPFNVDIISNIYEHGLGVIKLSGKVTKVGLHVFNGAITELYLPNSIEFLDYGAVSSDRLTTLYIPQNLNKLSYGAILGSKIREFTGHHVSDDGRCVVLNNTLYSFASVGLTEYKIPSSITHIEDYAFSRCENLEYVYLNEGLKSIGSVCFQQCTSLKKVVFPSTLETIGVYCFNGCQSIEGFYGNEKFHTADNMCLTNETHTDCYRFINAPMEEYTIPDGIEFIENYAFENKYIRTITFPNSIKTIGLAAFYHCDNLEAAYGECIASDNISLVIDGELQNVLIRKNLKEYVTPKGVEVVKHIMSYDDTIEKIVVSDDVKVLGNISSAFGANSKLHTVVLSAKLKEVNSIVLIGDCPQLKHLYVRSPIPPRVLQTAYNDSYIIAYPNKDLSIYVPKEFVKIYKTSPIWESVAAYIKPYDYTDLPTPDYYISTDYSQDGKVTVLQKATEGNGVDIVLMGDGYSDRQIADGTYERVMKLAYEKLFTEEPYKSYKELFNVYYVTAVSATEGYEHGNTAFGGWFGEGTAVGGSDDVAMNYALNAVEESRLNNTAIVVMMNSDRYAGTCYMYYPDGTNDYGSGVSVSYFPVGTDEAQLEQLLHHETCGHGFTKLADEYAYDYMGAVPADQVAATQSQRAWGWWKNVDFTSDTTQVLWAKFISDERYKYDGLGAYEGGMTYWSGVWRPTENSIMNTNVGGFNAPSREAIYYRIHKLAYGNSWTYDYEKFVEYDEINRKTVAMQATVRPMVLRPSEMPTPPVVVRKTWRDVLKR